MTIKTNRVRAAAFGVLALIAAAGAAGSAAAYDHRVRVINSTGHTLVNLYASRISTSRWGGDWLGRWSLAPGGSVVINFRDRTGACHYDIKARFSDRDVVTRHNFNVCAETRMTFVGN